MSNETKDINLDETAKTFIQFNKNKNRGKQFYIWITALIIGALLGCSGYEPLNEFFKFIATVFTRLFQFVAIPTIALSVMTTLSELGAKKNTGKIFASTITYTLLTTFSAAIIGLLLYITFTPGNLPINVIEQGSNTSGLNELKNLSYYDHILSIIPNNIIQPLISGNVLSVIIIAAAMGLGLSYVPATENKTVLIKLLYGLQELLFTLIRGLIFILPIGITAFAAELSAQVSSGSVIGILGKYTAVVLLGNFIQLLIVIPLFLSVKKINPIDTFKKMSPALAVAFFTKSSVATLPVTLACAEKNLNINQNVSRFVLPICTTVNMNGCAAFILITSLFVMQNAGFELTPLTMIMWVFISVFAAVGNAGVPMGCYFLTLSLMSSIGAPLGLLGIILPVYTIIDMVETVENVWSDSAVCALTNKSCEKKV